MDIINRTAVAYALDPKLVLVSFEFFTCLLLIIYLFDSIVLNIDCSSKWSNVLMKIELGSVREVKEPYGTSILERVR